MKKVTAEISKEKGMCVIRIYEDGKLINTEVVDKVKVTYDVFDWE